MTLPDEEPRDHDALPIILVAAPECHLCVHARTILADLGHQYLLDVSEIERDSPAGTSLLARFRPPFLPLLLVDGRPFGHGRISRRKLEAHLSRQLAPVRGEEV